MTSLINYNNLNPDKQHEIHGCIKYLKTIKALNLIQVFSKMNTKKELHWSVDQQISATYSDNWLIVFTHFSRKNAEYSSVPDSQMFPQKEQNRTSSETKNV